MRRQRMRSPPAPFPHPSRASAVSPVPPAPAPFPRPTARLHDHLLAGGSELTFRRRLQQGPTSQRRSRAALVVQPFTAEIACGSAPAQSQQDRRLNGS